ncbi:hypothetical protein BDZ45DRAFT_324301 [Acephala macrosclerotiorum]|nr:hypothetical protein BDZ45DRAFT_324301 [Acephala macrosclerotiorum]
MLCSICANLDLKELFGLEIVDVEHGLGNTSEISSRSNDCNFCRLLNALCEDGLKCLERREISEQLEGLGSRDFDFSQPVNVSIVRNPILCLSTKPFVVLRQGYHRDYIGPLVSLRTVWGDIRGDFEIDSSKFVNFKFLLKMIRSCVEEHADCQSKAEEIKLNTSMALIDVQEMCLVQPQLIPEYITLNYVWGTRRMLKTTK